MWKQYLQSPGNKKENEQLGKQRDNLQACGKQGDRLCLRLGCTPGARSCSASGAVLKYEFCTKEMRSQWQLALYFENICACPLGTIHGIKPE